MTDPITPTIERPHVILHGTRAHEVLRGGRTRKQVRRLGRVHGGLVLGVVVVVADIAARGGRLFVGRRAALGLGLGAGGGLAAYDGLGLRVGGAVGEVRGLVLLLLGGGILLWWGRVADGLLLRGRRIVAW